MSDLGALDLKSLLKLLVVALVAKYIHRVYYRSKYWPPGPRGLPILGNIFQLESLPWYIFTEWKAQYGPVVSLNLAGQPMIILNTHKAASDLLNHRSSKWRRMRRAVHEGLNVQAAEKYRPLQEIEASRLVNNLLRDPDNWDDHFGGKIYSVIMSVRSNNHHHRSAASTVLCSVYGWNPIEPRDDPVVQRINDILHRMARAALPGAYLVEFFPTMIYLPKWMAKWKREGLEWFAKDTKMFGDFLSDVEERASTGNCKPCLASSILENQNKLKLGDKEAAWVAGMMFAGGSGTTASSMSVFILAMVLYPDVMRKAQAEIDEVVGRDRLPNFGDYNKLPYIHAMVKEVLRWRPVVPCAAENDWYEGYYIPKGALVISNIWAMNRDPDLYPDYDEFRPDRFLDVSGKVNKKFSDAVSMGHVTYGFGRRICAGMNLANQSLFINIARILWALNIDQATDAHGNKIVPSRDDCVDEGLVVKPTPFACKITVRSSDVVMVLEHSNRDDAIWGGA
ncbi:cytochrome P450 [Collybia nuda]|uniref:Cytochrome P450 n=1 Tax=Collybia nuda TaxID=64659 RepID=A0A9P5Y4I9_9AGAR|nr:cytochrome P450 [Collybia nuda]